MEKTLDKAMDLLTALAARLGTSVEHLWPVLVRQAYYQGIVDLVIVGVLGPILVTVCVKAGRRALELGDKRDWSPQEGPMIFVAVLSGIVAAVLIPLLLGAGILRVLNPEFYALRYLLQAIGGGK